MTEARTPKILAVDDLQDNLDLIREVFEDEPYDIVTARSAEEALELSRGECPDVAILDVQMPDVDGYQLCQKLRESPQTRMMPVVFLTAHHTSATDAVRGLDLGACDYLTKPFKPEELRARVRAVLRVERDHKDIESELKEHAAGLELDIHSLEDAKHALEVVVAKNRELIAELQDTHRKLRHSEAMARALLNAPPESSLLIDRDGNVLACNAAAGASFDLSSEELTGRCVYDLLPADAARTRRQQVEAVFGTGQPVRFEEERGDRILDINIYPISDDNDEVTACAVFSQDITERKQAEAAAKELMQMKSDLVANVSHELRTPICSMKGFLDLLVKGKVTDPAVQQEFLTRTANDANRLTVLVNDLLDLSRLEAGRLELELDEVDLSALIAETLQSLEGLAGEKEIPLICTASETPLTVTGDRRRLQQVLTNLVGNGIKFSEARRSIRVTGTAEDGSCVVRVIDAGPGIPAEDLPKLFGRFYQSDSSGKRRGQGTGLGLYLSKQIIQAHGGEIGAESELGRGSTFFFTLPAQSEKGVPGSHRQEAALPPR